MAKPTNIRWKSGVGRNLDTGTWVVTYYDDTGKKVMRRRNPNTGKAFQTEREARQFKLDAEQERTGRGRPVETCDSLAKRFPDLRAGIDPMTREWYRERLKPFGEDFKGRRLSEITREEAREWSVGKGDRARAVSTMYRFAIDYQIDGVAYNPFRGLAERGEGRRGFRMISQEEKDQLVKIAREQNGDYGQHVAAVIETFASTGMRPAELYGLEWHDVDWEAGELSIRRQFISKTGNIKEYAKGEHPGRRVPLLPQTSEALRSIARIDQPYVFYAMRGERLRDRSLHYVWRPARDAFTAKLPEDHWLRRRVRDLGNRGKLDVYELRHLYGTMLARKGAHPSVIARLMGHRDGGKLALKLYIHTEDDDAISEVRRLFATETPDKSVAAQ